MPGSASSDLLDKRPLELIARALAAFAIVFWLSMRFGAGLIDALLPLYESYVQSIDNHYRIDLAVTRVGGHDKLGADLVVLGRAAVTRSFMVFGDTAKVMMMPGEVLQSSTAIGMLMQPAVMLAGLLLAWPLRSMREAAVRGVLGIMLLALWMLLGIPSWLWISMCDLPIRVVAPDELSVLTIANKMLLNGGAVVLGAVLAAVAIAGGRRLSWPPETA